MPKVSVIMPVFNTAAEYLKEAIDSVISQSFGDWELLIIDDGSTAHDTLDCINAYEGTPKIRVMRHEQNRGISAARNSGLDHAESEYIAFMDSDDLCHPERLEVQVKYLEGHPECGCLSSRADELNKEELAAMEYPYIENSTEIALKLMLDCNFLATPAVMLRRKLIESPRIRFRTDLTVLEDHAFWSQLADHTEFKILKQPLVTVRSHSSSISKTRRQAMKDLSIKVQAENLRRFTGDKFPLEVCECLYTGHTAGVGQLKEVLTLFEAAIAELTERSVPYELIRSLMLQRYRNLCLHNKGLSSQLTLFQSPLSRYFRLPLSWHLFCMLTRGIQRSGARGKK